MKTSLKIMLKSPKRIDFDVEHQNENMRKLDEEIGDVKKYAEHLKDKNVHVTEEEKKKIADIVIPNEIQGTLSAGKTELVLSSEKISADSTIDIYTDLTTKKVQVKAVAMAFFRCAVW